MGFDETRFWKWLVLLAGLLATGTHLRAQETVLGPLYSNYKLTLTPGERTEVLGPLFYSEEQNFAHTWAFPPLVSDKVDRATDYSEFHILYPILSYNRYGPEYRFQIIQLFSFSGGKSLTETNVDRFTLFPFYFQQRSAIPDKNYTAVFPFYGTLKNRLFRDEIHWLLWPIYVKTVKHESSAAVQPAAKLSLAQRYVRSRRTGVTTYNYLVPIFHVRHGDGLQGWQFWPLVGHEHKEITYRTNMWGEAELVGGHDNFFALWPLFFNQRTGVGTTNLARRHVFIPFYSVHALAGARFDQLPVAVWFHPHGRSGQTIPGMGLLLAADRVCAG